MPAPYIVLHKVGAGEVALDETVTIMSVSVTYIYVEYMSQLMIPMPKCFLYICVKLLYRIFGSNTWTTDIVYLPWIFFM